MTDRTEPETDKDRLQRVFRRLLWEADEKKVRTLLASDLGLPEGTPEHTHLVNCWREYREREGWKVS
jgi:hypothetical protein